mgnify:CR=1 FL=1
MSFVRYSDYSEMLLNNYNMLLAACKVLEEKTEAQDAVDAMADYMTQVAQRVSAMVGDPRDIGRALLRQTHDLSAELVINPKVDMGIGGMYVPELAMLLPGETRSNDVILREHCERGLADYVDREPARRVDMAWRYTAPTAGCELLADFIAFDWNSADSWFEEDDEVFKHARDPYHRVDTLHSSRHVQVFIDGVQVANSTSPRLLFETGFPTRYYLPKVDVRLDLLVPSATHSVCPYKGTASYCSVQLPDGGRLVSDIVWYYPAPIAECPKIENLLCFFNEKVDIVVDGVAQPRPVTPWS